MKIPLRSIMILLGLACCSGLPCRAQSPKAQVDHIVAGFTRASIPDLNLRDLEASFKAITTALGRKRGYAISMKLRVFERPAEFEGALQNNEIQMAIIDAWDYLGMHLPPTMEPAFVHGFQAGVLKDYLLLARRRSGPITMRDLKGTELVLLRSSSSLMSSPWLDVLLAQEHLGTKEAFFRHVETVPKPAAAVLPVFFGKRGACVVERGAYQTMVDMNPQVDRGLQVVATSPAFLNSITFLNTKGWSSAQARQDFHTALEELHQDPEGSQLLLMFKVDRMVPFRPAFLDSLRELRAQHQRLLGRSRP